MAFDYYHALRPLLFALPAETAHNLAVRTLSLDLLPAQNLTPAASLRQTFWGLDFAHPLGLAAGFDKNAECLHGLANQGFAFVETGSITPQPQPGNPKPRLFRLKEDEAVINRMGFNNHGIERFVDRLKTRPRNLVIGANLGKNKDSIDAVADYVHGIKRVWPHADYITVNISSPNTVGLRDLQKPESLAALLAALKKQRAACEQQHARETRNFNAAPQSIRHVPLLLKLAPDLEDAMLPDIAHLAIETGLDGILLTNTTLARPNSLANEQAKETGGLSGHPLFTRSTQVLAQMHHLLQGRIPLIGIGGVDSPRAAYEKIRAGASLVQLYSALTFHGFGLVKRIVHELPTLLAADGFTHISQAIGSGNAEWREKKAA